MISFKSQIRFGRKGTNFVITSTRMPVGRKPAHLCGLATLLRRFGVEGERPLGYDKSVFLGKRAKRSLWDLWDATRARWREIVWKHHPDRGGCTKTFARLSEIHDTILRRLKKKGISTA